MNLGESLARCDSPKQVGTLARNMTLTEQLEDRKQDLESRLAEINSALEALKKNPEIEGLLNLISRVRY